MTPPINQKKKILKKFKKMETIGNGDEGNIQPHPLREVPGLYYVFTFWVHLYPDISPEKWAQILGNFGNYFFGVELTPTTQKLHYQGFMQFTVKTRPTEKFKDFIGTFWQKTKGGFDSNKTYCSKDNKIFTNMEFKEPIKDYFVLDNLIYKLWQIDLIETFKQEPDRRKIIWIYDPIGKQGKTTFARHIVQTHKGVYYVTGKASDIKCGIAKHLEKNPNFNPKIILFYYTRDDDKGTSYNAIEQVKDAMFFSTKFDSGMILYNIPHVVILANHYPDTSKLSEDRWDIRQIGETKAVVDTFQV